MARATVLAAEARLIQPPPQSMMRGSLFSFLLHAGVILSSLIILPHWRDSLPPLPAPVIVDVVQISDITNLPPMPKQQAEKKIETPVKEEPKAPEPPKPQPKPQEAAPAKKEAPKLDPKPKAEIPKPAQPEPKKAEKPDDFASVLKTVEKFKQQSAAAPTPPAPTPTQSYVQAQNFIPSLPLSISEMDAVRRQIEQCWNLPAGARDAQNLVVEVGVVMNPDGTVQAAKVINDNGRIMADPFFRSAAESAIRALMNPRCTPLKLPPDKYHQWKTMTLNFDPKLMLGY